MEVEELKTANQTSEESAGTVNQADEQVGTADTDNEQTGTNAFESNDTEFTDGNNSGGGTDQPAESEKPKKEPQSRERNAEEARKRREAEKQEAIKRARVEAILEATDGKNPYTNEDMTDADDVEEYLNMRKIEKEGKDPIADYASWMKQQARVRKAEQEAKERQVENVRNDLDAFKKANPDVDTDALFQDEAFSDYAEGKLGSKPLTQIYEGYRKLVGNTRKAEQEKAAQALANSRATPGSAQNTSTGETDFFTKEQVQKMSPDEVNKNLDKILKSQKKW